MALRIVKSRADTDSASFAEGQKERHEDKIVEYEKFNKSTVAVIYIKVRTPIEPVSQAYICPCHPQSKSASRGP
jgi:hypothetical protein